MAHAITVWYDRKAIESGDKNARETPCGLVLRQMLADNRVVLVCHET